MGYSVPKKSVLKAMIARHENIYGFAPFKLTIQGSLKTYYYHWLNQKVYFLEDNELRIEKTKDFGNSIINRSKDQNGVFSASVLGDNQQIWAELQIRCHAEVELIESPDFDFEEFKCDQTTYS
jgi:hypothetical protein